MTPEMLVFEGGKFEGACALDLGSSDLEMYAASRMGTRMDASRAQWAKKFRAFQRSRNAEQRAAKRRRNKFDFWTTLQAA